MTGAGRLRAEGRRVVVRTVQRSDVEPYRRAVEASRERLERWNPVDPGDVVAHLERQSDAHRTFVLLAREPEGSHGVVGRVNLTNVVLGRFRSGVLGYDAFDPYAGRGLFREGLALVVGLALAPAGAGGAGLHRVEANVQPGNAASAGVLRSLGFRHEGSTPRMLLLGGADGEQRWRDHERYAVTVEEWPGRPYAPSTRRRRVVLVTGPAAERTPVATALARELVLPLLGDGLADDRWSLLASCPEGAVLESSVLEGPAQRAELEAGARRAGVDPTSVVEVRCGGGDPPGPGPALRAPAGPLGARAVTDLALRARALSSG